MYTHLNKLQEIADANSGHRASGTPGYDASVDYVAQFLKDKGFDVQTPEFELLDRTEGGNPKLVVGGRDFHVDQASLLITTPPGGLKAITLRPQKAAGCRAADYGPASVKGAIAVVDDTGCSIVDKQNSAVDKGAVGLLVVSAPGTSGSPAGLFTPGYYQQLTVPVGVIDNDANAALRRTNAPVTLVLDSKPVMKKTRNILAQTKTGDTQNVIMVGAHLDSAPGSPGINDNGSGVAAVLELARILQPVALRRQLLFAAFGGEEQGLFGSGACAEVAAQEGWPIDVVINLDMVAYNPNPGNGRVVVEYDQGNRHPGNDAAARAYGLLMAQATADYTTLQVEHTDIWNSDYMPFEAKGYACIGAYEGGDNPFYHKSTDVPERTDLTYLAEVVKAVLATILILAQ
jgi:Zn-dependent M28 family amino/carboxypeptidase